jgi:hypothetical protein
LPQNRRSSRNSGWKMAVRLSCRSTEHLAAQSGYGCRLYSALFGSPESRQQTARVSRRPQQMSGLDKALQLIRGEKGDIPSALPPNNHCFLLVHNPIKHAGEILAKTGVRSFSRHGAPASLYRIPVRLVTRRAETP